MGIVEINRVLRWTEHFLLAFGHFVIVNVGVLSAHAIMKWVNKTVELAWAGRNLIKAIRSTFSAVFHGTMAFGTLWATNLEEKKNFFFLEHMFTLASKGRALEIVRRKAFTAD